MTTLSEAANSIQPFIQGSLTNRISTIESHLHGFDKNACQLAFPTLSIEPSLLDAAFTLKHTAGQINVLIHSVGILLSLPQILQNGEIIESLSLGAGNTGRLFDLETNIRVAEFKFINWRGGPESIRQNSLFKDFYFLAEYETDKERYLFVIGTKYPLKFLTGGRSLQSVMSKNNKLWEKFQKQYGKRFAKVCEYYEYRKERVQLMDITKIIPGFLDEYNQEEVEEDK